MDAHSPWFMSAHKLLNNLRSKSSTGRFIPGCQARIRAQAWQDFMVTLATEQLFTYRPLGLHQGPFCFSVVLALVLGALSFMPTSCLSVKAARREAKHPPLVWGNSVRDIALTLMDLSFPASAPTPQPIPRGFSRLYGQAAVSFLLMAQAFLGDELAAGQPPSLSKVCCQLWLHTEPSPGAALSRCSIPGTSRTQQ